MRVKTLQGLFKILIGFVFAVILEITNKRLENIGIKLRLRIDKNVIQALQSKSKGEEINIPKFISDTGFCAATKENLQKAIQIFDEACMRFGLTLSIIYGKN